MLRNRLFLAAVVGAAAWFGLAGTAEAAPRVVGPNRPVGIPNPNPPRPPGWDWWRTYPWSPYNAWRNPYGYYPYTPYVSPPSYYVPSPPAPSRFDDLSMPAVPAVPAVTAPTPAAIVSPDPMLPRPTGAVRTPPVNAGLIRVELPSSFATVTFNGTPVNGAGPTRYYVTPDLKSGTTYQYQVAVSYSRNGQQVLQQQQVTVAPGQTAVVDFARK